MRAGAKVVRGFVLGTIFCLIASAKGEPAMWVIKDKDSTIYLLGTFHILRPETQWETDRIKQAIHQSTELWLEIANENEAEMATLLHKYGSDTRRPLSHRLTPEQYARLTKTAESYTFPVALLEPMKPWYAAMNLQLLPMLKAGYNPNAGVEQVVKFQARVEGDKIGGFETVEEQIRLFDRLPEADQVALLDETLTEVDEGVERMEELSKAWSEGNTEFFAAAFLSELKRDSPSLYQHLLVDRNIRWSRKIAAMLKRSGVQMIAVGAGHLVGPDSVQAQLEKLGIKAERY